MTQKPYVLISYSDAYRELAIGLYDALKANHVPAWIDIDKLTPGSHWRSEIQEAMENASVVLVLITEKNAGSSWILHESATPDVFGKGLVPVAFGMRDRFPKALSSRQAIFLPEQPTIDDFTEAATEVSHILNEWSRKLSQGKAEEAKLPDALIEDANATIQRISHGGDEEFATPNSIFLVHGHDEDSLIQVKRFIESVGVTPIVLREAAGPDQSLLQRFFRVAEKAKFAVVILSADDVGASRIQFDAPGVGERCLQFRARQNVILELGFFYGQLGWDHVFVLLKQPDQVFPNFEVPSDIGGAVYDRMDSSNRWKIELRNRMKKAGFAVS